MKRIIALVLVLLLVPSVCFGAEDKKPLGRLSKLGVSEETLNEYITEGLSVAGFAGIKFFDTLNSMVAALDSERISAFEIDSYTANYLAARTGQYVAFRTLASAPVTQNYYLNYSMLLREEDGELCERISSAIRDMKADGTLDAFKKKYIDDCIAGTDPEAVKPEHFDGAETFKVALTGDLPPMDYFSEAGEAIGFNTALVSEIARRLKMNAEFISVNSGARAVALQSKACDAVFWSEVGDYKVAHEGRFEEDIPEHAIVTEPYLGCPLSFVTLPSSPLLQK